MRATTGALIALVATTITLAYSTPKATCTRINENNPNQEATSKSDQAQEKQKEANANYEGVTQVRRMARNVRKKMDILSDRVDQLQSIIAQDHANRSSMGESGASDQLSAPADQAAAGSSHQENWSPARATNGAATEADSDLDADSNHADQIQPSDNQLVVGAGPSDEAPELSRLYVGTNSNSSSSGQTEQLQQQSMIRSFIPGRTSGLHLGSETGDGSRRRQIASSATSDDTSEQGEQSTVAPASNSAADQPTMLGPEWVPNGSYQYFNELNAKNHRGAGAGASLSSQATTAAQTALDRKFQNMTILNSDTDLANSYSFQQSQPQVTSSGSAEGSATHASAAAAATTTTSSPPGATVTTSRPATAHSAPMGSLQTSESQESPVRRPNSAVKTYTSSNYGKSQRHSHSATATPMYYSADWAPQTSNDTFERASNSGRQLQSPNTDQQQVAPIRWPTLASPSTAVALPPTANNYAQNRYSAVMLPANGPRLDDEQQSSSARNQPKQHAGGDSGGYETGTDESGPDGPRLRAHKYSVVLASDKPPAVHDNAGNSRRRSIDARRQLTSATESSLYERQHTEQPPPSLSPDTYSSRADEAGSLAVASQAPQLMSGASASGGGASNGAFTANASENQDLKHDRSQALHPGGPASPDDSFAVSASSSPGVASGVQTMRYAPSEPISSSSSAAVDKHQSALTQMQAPSVGDPPMGAIGAQDQLLRQQQHRSQPFAFSQLPGEQQPQRHYYATAATSNNQELAEDTMDGQQHRHQFGADLSSAEQQEQLLQQSYDQQQMRPSDDAGYSSPVAGVSHEALQAAVSGYLQRQRQQQQLQQAAQIYLDRYKQQQRALAAQLAQQRLHEASSAPAQSRAFYAQQLANSDQQETTVKRVAPESGPGFYVPASSQLVRSATNEPSYASFFTPTQNYQQVGSDSPMSLSGGAAAVRAAAQSAYQRLLYAQAAATAQQQAQFAGTNNQNSLSNNGAVPTSTGRMYATSAVNSPVFYEAPPKVAQTTESLASGTATGGRRNYLASLFKPQASSRYYYAPQLLSPIGLTAPATTTLQTLYGPAATLPGDSVVATSSPLAQYYAAAANPYFTTAALSLQQQAAANPYATAYQAQQVDPHQYQQALTAAATAAAAAAAAAYHVPHQHHAHQAHHFVPTGATSASGSGDAEMVAESSLVGTSGDSGSNQSGYSSSAASDSSADSAQGSDMATSSSSKSSMRQWYSMAGLLAGILPMGVLLAALLPTINLAGRKKRELDLYGMQNLTDIFGSWSIDPARILSAIVGPLNLPELHKSQTASHALRSARLDLAKPWRLGQTAERQAGNWTHTGQLGATTASTTTTLGAPTPGALASTTPLPQANSIANLSPSAQPNQGLKATLKRALSALNNFVMSNAQKRKHRSSVLDLGQQSGGGGGGGGSLFRSNPLSFTDIKGHLAELVRARLLASYPQGFGEVARDTLKQTPRSESDSSPATTSTTRRPAPLVIETAHPLTSLVANQELGLNSSQDVQRQSVQLNSEIRISNGPHGGQNVSAKQHSLELISAKLRQTNDSAMGLAQQNVASNSSNSPAGATRDTQTASANNADNKRGLMSCLYKILCDIATRMRKPPGPSKSRPTIGNNTATSTQANDDRAAKEFLNQLIEEIIEADKGSKVFGLRMNRSSPSGPTNPDTNGTLFTLDALYRTVLKQECSAVYDCPDPLLLRKSLMGLKLMKS